MSHELRTPLNSLLILATPAADNQPGNLTDEQVRFADDHPRRRQRPAPADRRHPRPDQGRGRADGRTPPARSPSPAWSSYVEAVCRPLTADKGLEFGGDARPPAAGGAQHRRAPAAADPAQPAVQRGEVHRRRRGAAARSRRRCPAGRQPALRVRPTVVAFGVSDTGIGIPADKLKIIFEAFQQADGTTSRGTAGPGWACRSAGRSRTCSAASMRGRPTIGRGSTFTCTCRSARPAW